jgi:5'-methylthioadenosine phosphorylase
MTRQPAPVDIGIIGGSGFYRIDGFSDITETAVDTPFGKPSDTIMVGKLHGRQVAFLPRHGRDHLLLPSEVNYRANIHAFKSLGVKRLLAVTAVGSLREDRAPLDMVVPDQVIDRTHRRISTFFGDGVVAHVSLARPFCPDLSRILCEAAFSVTKRIHSGGTLVTIEGPAFSSRAESELYRQWGCDLIGMTTAQEAKLAREAEICYGVLAMVTDYDCWRDTETDAVSVETVLGYMQQNSALAKQIIARVIPELTGDRSCRCKNSLEGAIMTAPELISEENRRKLTLLLGDRIGL